MLMRVYLLKSGKRFTWVGVIAAGQSTHVVAAAFLIDF
jgi:hypothetical protein